MTGALLEKLQAALHQRCRVVVATVAAVKGSVPRQAGSKMLIYPDGSLFGTIGGGKFESLVISDALALPRNGPPLLRTYPLHEGSPESFGAICGGEVTVLLEPQQPPRRLILAGAGHCARALAALVQTCGWEVVVLDDRPGQLIGFPASACIAEPGAAAWIAGHVWAPDEALVLVARNFVLDQEALEAALGNRGMGYLGMIGSRRKVQRVRAALHERGFADDAFEGLHAPIGLDLGVDHPAEIAVSIFAEILTVLNGTSGQSLAHSA